MKFYIKLTKEEIYDIVDCIDEQIYIIRNKFLVSHLGSPFRKECDVKLTLLEKLRKKFFIEDDNIIKGVMNDKN